MFSFRDPQRRTDDRYIRKSDDVPPRLTLGRQLALPTLTNLPRGQSYRSEVHQRKAESANEFRIARQGLCKASWRGRGQ
jgi:hypothetical protein